MKLTEFATALEAETGFPVAYHHFEVGAAPDLPYLVYFVANRDDDVQADDAAYVKVRTVYVELYSPDKDLAAEEAVESFFDAHELRYSSEETYLDDEKMYELIYELDLI